MCTIVKKKLFELLHRKRTLRALGMTGLLVALAVIAGPAWGAAIDLTLDDFSNNTGPHPLVANGVSNQTLLSGVLGGSRDATIDATGGVVFLTIGGTNLDVGAGPGATPSLQLDYTNVGTRDLTAATSSLDFSISANDQGGTFQLVLTDGVNTGTTNLAVASGALGAHSITIGTNGDFAGVNLASVTGVSFVFSGNLEEDLRLSGGLTLNDVNQPAPPVVPEPASLALWTVMGLGSVFFSRRRKATVARG